MSDYEFKNMNAMPVVIPTKGGYGRTFRMGESTTDPWFSRFVGPRQLTKVPVVEKVISSIPNVLDKRRINDVLSKLQGETTDYVKKGGMYICKHCDLFRTGSLPLFKMHLSDYHQIEEAVRTTKGVTVSAVKQAIEDEDKVIKVSQVVEDKSTTSIETIPDDVLIPKTKETLDSVCVCSFCGRKFKTEIGKDKHVKKKHSVIKG